MRFGNSYIIEDWAFSHCARDGTLHLENKDKKQELPKEAFLGTQVQQDEKPKRSLSAYIDMLKQQKAEKPPKEPKMSLKQKVAAHRAETKAWWQDEKRERLRRAFAIPITKEEGWAWKVILTTLGAAASIAAVIGLGVAFRQLQEAIKTNGSQKAETTSVVSTTEPSTAPSTTAPSATTIEPITTEAERETETSMEAEDATQAQGGANQSTTTRTTTTKKSATSPIRIRIDPKSGSWYGETLYLRVNADGTNNELGSFAVHIENTDNTGYEVKFSNNYAGLVPVLGKIGDTVTVRGNGTFIPAGSSENVRVTVIPNADKSKSATCWITVQKSY